MTVFQGPAERRLRPKFRFRGYHVHMVKQNDGFLGAIPLEAGVNISPPGSRLDDSRVNALTIEDPFEELSGFDFVPWWVRSVDLNVTAEKRHGFLFDVFPYDPRVYGKNS